MRFILQKAPFERSASETHDSGYSTILGRISKLPDPDFLSKVPAIPLLSQPDTVLLIYFSTGHRIKTQHPSCHRKVGQV